MKNSIGIFVAVAVVAGGLLIAPKAAEAYRGDPNTVGPNCTAEQHEAVENAIESNNYVAWKNLMQNRGRVTQVVNQANFARFAEMHKLMDQGKTVEAGKIRTELGLGLQNGSGRGMGMGRMSK